jgi:hypothetical protein
MTALEPRFAGLQTLGDQDGHVVFGWLEEDVFYAQFVGGLSASLGTSFVSRLTALLREIPALRYFSDASQMTHYDLLARSAFTRLVLANRRKFSDIVCLMWSGGVTISTKAFVAAVGEPVTLLTDEREFRARLTSAAPMALPRLNSKTSHARTDLAPSEPPPRHQR